MMHNSDMVDFFVVGIGGSAGGLNAVMAFFESGPPEMASYIVNIHYPAQAESNLVQIIARVTTLQVMEIEEGMPVAPGMVYTVPPAYKVGLKDGCFVLEKRPTHPEVNFTINYLFGYIAQFAKKKGVAIIMSGTGTDGKDGAVAIEEEGGYSIVQDPATAIFDGMPLTSIRYDHPDFVVSPVEMPSALNRIIRGEVVKGNPGA